jgi:hypothetical protein
LTKINVDPDEFIADVRAGLNNNALMQKYGLPPQALESLFTKAIGKGLLTMAELKERAKKLRADEELLQEGPPRGISGFFKRELGYLALGAKTLLPRIVAPGFTLPEKRFLLLLGGIAVAALVGWCAATNRGAGPGLEARDKDGCTAVMKYADDFKHSYEKLKGEERDKKLSVLAVQWDDKRKAVELPPDAFPALSKFEELVILGYAAGDAAAKGEIDKARVEILKKCRK